MFTWSSNSIWGLCDRHHQCDGSWGRSGEIFSFLMGQGSFQRRWDFRRVIKNVCDLDGRRGRPFYVGQRHVQRRKVRTVKGIFTSQRQFGWSDHFPGITGVIIGRYATDPETQFPHFTGESIRSRKLKWLGQGYMAMKSRRGVTTLAHDFLSSTFPTTPCWPRAMITERQKDHRGPRRRHKTFVN